MTPVSPETIEDVLLAEGAVTPEGLERARRIAGNLKGARRPGELLVEMGKLARAEYERVARLHRSRLSLAQILHGDGDLESAAFATYESMKAATPNRSDRALLVDTGFVTEERFLKAVADRHAIPFVVPDVGLVDLAILAQASMRYLLSKKVLPLRVGDGALTAVLADPLNTEVITALERMYKLPVRVCCATEERIVSALETLRRMREGDARPDGGLLQYHEITAANDDSATGEGAVAVLDYLLLRAVQMKASDVHIEPLQSKVRVRVRVDGVLLPLTELPAGFAPQLVSRVKVLAGMDIAERRQHQDGRIGVRIENSDVDVRVSSYSSTFGETIVLRLLDRRRGLVAIDALGFEPKIFANLRDVVLRSSSGLVLITGPTGSGKTTSLYSFVDYVNSPDVKTMSCEDPVEYVVEGMAQCSVQPKAGVTFASSLRAMMRQDPDIVVVGEVRDNETAALAIEAALTGHRVFSTFHTEDAVGSLVRLTDMGIAPFLTASTLSCVIAQRLVRRVCTDCREEAEVTRDDLRYFGLERTDLRGLPFVRGAGCAQCNGTGYRGREGVHEVLIPDDDLRDAILARSPSKDLRKLARAIPGFFTLQETGLLKAAAGITTLAEVAANVPRDSEARPPAELRRLVGGKGLL